MRRLALLLLLAPAALALPVPQASAALLCSHTATTGSVLGSRTIQSGCYGYYGRYICTDSNPGTPEAGISIRWCHPAP